MKTYYLPLSHCSSGNITILWSDECELCTEWPCPHRRDCSYDADEGGVRSESGDSEGGGGGGQLEGTSSPNHCHINDVADNHTIDLVCRRRVPGDGG